MTKWSDAYTDLRRQCLPVHVHVGTCIYTEENGQCDHYMYIHVHTH